jgi:Tol biopolymer transport system component
MCCSNLKMSIFISLTLLYNFWSCNVNKDPLSVNYKKPISFNKIAFLSNRDGTRCIYIMDKDGTNQTNLTPEFESVTGPLFSPIGDKIFFVWEDYINDLEICSMDPNGDNKFYLTNNDYDDGISKISQDGSKMLYTVGTWPSLDICLMNTDGSNKKNLTNHPAWYSYLDMSNDGSKIVYNLNDWSQIDIYLMKIGGTHKTNLTSSSTLKEIAPEFSPDGNNILYISDKEENWGLYTMNLTYKYERKLAAKLVGSQWFKYSPDGRKIVYTLEVNDAYDIFIMNADGTQKTNLTKSSYNEIDPSFTPDGSHIFFSSYDRDGNDEIYIMDIDGNDIINLTNNPARDIGPSAQPVFD